MAFMLANSLIFAMRMYFAKSLLLMLAMHIGGKVLASVSESKVW